MADVLLHSALTTAFPPIAKPATVSSSSVQFAIENICVLHSGCFAPPRTTTPPSGVSVRTESRRTRFNCGVVRSPQHTEKSSRFEPVSILVKGGWKETRGFQRPITSQQPVSESRMASRNPFETKRKKARIMASSWVRDVKVAEREGFEPSRRFPAYTLSRRAPSTTRPPLRRGVCSLIGGGEARGWRGKSTEG